MDNSDHSATLDVRGVRLLDAVCALNPPLRPWPVTPMAIGVSTLPEGDKLHHKAAVIDDRTVISGSMNWSAEALRSNDENVLILHSPAVATAFRQDLKRLHASAVYGPSPSLRARAIQAAQRCAHHPMSPANAAFQTCATGMPSGKAVAVGVDPSISRTRMVKFDGLGPDGSLLIEAKGFGYKIDEKLGVWKDDYVSRRMQDKLLRQLDRQLDAAKSVGRSVQWVVPNEGIRGAFEKLLKGKIPVKTAAPRTDCPKSSTSTGGDTAGSF